MSSCRDKKPTRSQAQPLAAVAMCQVGVIEANPSEVRERSATTSGRLGDSRFAILDRGPLRYVPGILYTVGRQLQAD